MKVKHTKLYTSLVVVIVLAAGGGWYLAHKVTGEVANQVLAVVANTSVQNEIAGLSNNPLLASAAGIGTGNNPANAQSQTTGSGAVSGSQSGKGSGTSGGSNPPSNSHSSSQGTAGQGSGSPSTSTSGQTSQGQGGQASAQGSSGQGQGNTGASGVPNFTSRQQLIQFAMSRFTTSQIANYVRLYAERASLSPQYKAQIKEQILSHFTPAQIQAMAAAAREYK